MTNAAVKDLPEEVYLIGFTDNRVDDQNLPDAGAVVGSDIGPAAVVLSDMDPENPLESLSTTHDFLIAVSAQGTVLPVRFGTKVPKDELSAATSRHRELFDKFIGLCEVRIVATYDEEETLSRIAPEIDRDASELERGEAVAHKLAAQRRKDAATLLETFRDRVKDHKLTDAKADWEAFRISLLIPMPDLDATEALLRTLAEGDLSHVRFKMTAPLPIYSFV